ncbi:hypothetical protein [Mangrovivirga cuniculi]|nr:hypothetical protein [Mangrovivirga cuniculi]
MKKHSYKLILLGIIEAAVILLIAYHQNSEASVIHPTAITFNNDTLKKESLKILETKCNSCHRKQNPFMVFKGKNMSKKAAKIYTQVFVKQRMPKGDEIKLTSKEYATLKKWLNTENIY